MKTFLIAILGLWISLACAQSDELGVSVEKAVDSAVQSKIIPGAVVLVGTLDRDILHRAFGDREIRPAPIAASLDTIYDLASMTKLFTATGIAILVDRGQLSYSTRVIDILPAFADGQQKNRITIEQLLRHRAGLPAGLLDAAYVEGNPTATWANIFATRLKRNPDVAFEYSDIGYILLGKIIETISGQSLDQFMESEIAVPLGMVETHYRPSGALMSRCAPTSVNPIAPIDHCIVHDPWSQRLNGVAGHAGIFSTSTDVARFARFFLNRGILDGHRILSESIVDEMTSAPNGMGRGLGPDVDSVYATSVRGDGFSVGQSFGHTGFTGTSLWIDKPTQRFVIILTNRVHLGLANVNPLRRDIATAAARALH